MSCAEESTWTDKSCGCFTSLTKWYSNIRSCFQRCHSIHPTDPNAPLHSEFFEVESHRRLRIIHITPESIFNDVIDRSNKPEQRRKSLRPVSEEYWFTRWNRPLRRTICNCSFRTSQRISVNSDQLPTITKSNSFAKGNANCDKLKSEDKTPQTLEMYVEKLISDTLLLAYKNIADIIGHQDKIEIDHGITNMSYEVTEDEVDLVQLRNDTYKFLFSKDNDASKSQKRIRSRCHCDSRVPKTKKPIVLLLHGIGSSADVWIDVLQCLVTAGHEVIAPDLLGHGFSSVPRAASAYKFSNLLKHTIAIFDKYINCSDLQQCIVIGHSFGCSLAGALARYRAQHIVQLVLISGGGPTPLAPPVLSSEVYLYGCLQILLKPLLLCGMKRTLFYSSRGKQFEACDSESGVPRYVLQHISRGQRWPEGDAAFHRRILIPTLLVHGLLDERVTLVQECEMERTIPRSFLEVLPRAGHIAMLDTPDQLCHMILCFIDWWTK